MDSDKMLHPPQKRREKRELLPEVEGGEEKGMQSIASGSRNCGRGYVGGLVGW